MRLTKILMALLAMLFAGTMPAIAEEVVYTPFEKYDFRNGDFSIIGKTGGKLYVYRSAGSEYYLDAYGDDMNKLATVILDFFPEKIYETRFISYPDKIIILFQSVESNRVIQQAALLDKNGRLLKGPLKLKDEKAGIFGPTREYFASAISEDKKNIYIYAPMISRNTVALEGLWMDDELNISARTTAKFSADNSISAGDAHIANDGTVYFPAYTPTGTRNYADEVWLLKLDKGARSFTSAPLPLNDLYAGGTFMKLDNINNRIYVSGFYSDKKNGNYDGVLYTYYDMAANRFENRKAIAFDERIVAATGERNRSRAFNDFAVRDIIIKNDGGFVLVAENFFITTRNNYSGPGFGYYSYYYSPMMGASMREFNYGDIMALSYDGDGNREWYSFVRKQQYSQEDGGVFSSYALLNTGGALGFLYNDYTTSTSALALSSITAGGEQNRIRINHDSNIDFVARHGRQVSAREVIVPVFTRREIGFAKIVF